MNRLNGARVGTCEIKPDLNGPVTNGSCFHLLTINSKMLQNVSSSRKPLSFDSTYEDNDDTLVIDSFKKKLSFKSNREQNVFEYKPKSFTKIPTLSQPLDNKTKLLETISKDQVSTCAPLKNNEATDEDNDIFSPHEENLSIDATTYTDETNRRGDSFLKETNFQKDTTATNDTCQLDPAKTKNLQSRGKGKECRMPTNMSQEEYSLQLSSPCSSSIKNGESDIVMNQDATPSTVCETMSSHTTSHVRSVNCLLMRVSVKLLLTFSMAYRMIFGNLKSYRQENFLCFSKEILPLLALVL
jgi:hypothetical protein